MSRQKLPVELQRLVSYSVALLGRAISQEYGPKSFQRIEALRVNMKGLRKADYQTAFAQLSLELKALKRLSHHELFLLAHAYGSMLELINRCESAYRTVRLEAAKAQGQLLNPKNSKAIPYALIFVLTAHPTEARSIECLGIFDNIQRILEQLLRQEKLKASSSFTPECEEELSFYLKLALWTPLSPTTRPRPQDEAQHIFSLSLRPEIIKELLRLHQRQITVTLRTWVGGDKDGHPLVNEQVMHECLNLSRSKLLAYFLDCFQNFRQALQLPSLYNGKLQQLLALSNQVKIILDEIHCLRPGDGKRIKKLRQLMQQKEVILRKLFQVIPQSFKDMQSLLWCFPALVLPLELREDAQLIKKCLQSKHEHLMSIEKMLKLLDELSQGHSPKWYARGLVLSMVEDATDIQNGLELVQKHLSVPLPVIPLFEQHQALTQARPILEECFKRNPQLIKRHQKYWGGRFEVMLGYSDASKENGAFAGRLAIAQAIRQLDEFLAQKQLTPVFFHGSGGSVERGGGSVKEQTDAWPLSALNIFKMTIQGEMVARTFATAAIFDRQVEKILEAYQTAVGLGSNKSSNHQYDLATAQLLEKFSGRVQAQYKAFLSRPRFIDFLSETTPYPYLSELRLGSRPAKRKGSFKLESLRAIPWALCWTQTRLLFPVWWGLGSAWQSLSRVEQQQLKQLVQNKQDPFLSAFIKLLGFTLAKVELPIWRLYLESLSKDGKLKSHFLELVGSEWELTLRFFKAISGTKDYLWYRPWLGQSIGLRSTMIHPINLIQIIALERKEMGLLRETVTGVACGMLTTG